MDNDIVEPTEGADLLIAAACWPAAAAHSAMLPGYVGIGVWVDGTMEGGAVAAGSGRVGGVVWWGASPVVEAASLGLPRGVRVLPDLSCICGDVGLFMRSVAVVQNVALLLHQILGSGSFCKSCSARVVVLSAC